MHYPFKVYSNVIILLQWKINFNLTKTLKNTDMEKVKTLWGLHLLSAPPSGYFEQSQYNSVMGIYNSQHKPMLFSPHVIRVCSLLIYSYCKTLMHISTLQANKETLRTMIIFSSTLTEVGSLKMIYLCFCENHASLISAPGCIDIHHGE